MVPPLQGQLMGTWPVHRAPCGEEPLVLVQCSAVTALKFLIISDQGALRFNVELGPVTGVAGPAPLGTTGLMGETQVRWERPDWRKRHGSS